MASFLTPRGPFNRKKRMILRPLANAATWLAKFRAGTRKSLLIGLLTAAAAGTANKILLSI